MICSERWAWPRFVCSTCKRLLGLGQHRALAIDFVLRAGLRLLGQRQAFVLRGQPHLARFDALIGVHRQLGPALLIRLKLFKLPLPMQAIVGQLREPRLVFVLRFAAVTNLGFKPRHVGVGGKQLALRTMDAVARSEMRLARRFKPRFGLAQRSVLRFEFVLRAINLALQALTLGQRVVALPQAQQLLLARQLAVVIAVLPSHRRLPFEALHLDAEFEPDVLDTHQVVARVADAVLGLAAPLLVLGDAGRFFEKNAQLVRPRLDDP